MSSYVKKYNNFIENIQFSGMRLISSDFIRKPEYDNYEYQELKKSLLFETDRIGVNEDGFFPIVTWTLILKMGNKNLVKIQVGYELAYDTECEYEDSEQFEKIINRFLSSVVKPTSYPYFRQKVAAISNDAFLEIPTLPMLKLFPNNNKAVEKMIVK